MVSYKTIIEDIKTLVDKHKMIASFGTGDITQLIYLTQEIKGQDNTTNKAPLYPLLYVIPQNVTRNEQFIVYDFNILICDVMNAKNYDIETQLLSDTLQIAEDVLAQFKYSVTAQQGDYEDKYDIILPTTLTSFTERFDDILVGWNFTLRITADIPLNRCIAPYNNFN